MKVLTPQQLAALRTIDTPTICNAIESFKVRPNTEGFLGTQIRCLFPDLGVMVGYAVTAKVDASSPAAGVSTDLYWRWLDAIYNSPKPCVLVFKDVGPNPEKSAHCGDEMAGAALRLGAVGLITDGGVRDVEQVRRLGFHYFSIGAVPSHGTGRMVDVNVPIQVDGVTVNLGDLIHADVNGVTVIPAEIAERVYEEAVRVREKEFNRYLKYLAGPEVTLERLKEMFGG